MKTPRDTAEDVIGNLLGNAAEKGQFATGHIISPGSFCACGPGFCMFEDDYGGFGSECRPDRHETRACLPTCPHCGAPNQGTCPRQYRPLCWFCCEYHEPPFRLGGQNVDIALINSRNPYWTPKSERPDPGSDPITYDEWCAKQAAPPAYQGVRITGLNEGANKIRLMKTLRRSANHPELEQAWISTNALFRGSVIVAILARDDAPPFVRDMTALGAVIKAPELSSRSEPKSSTD